MPSRGRKTPAAFLIPEKKMKISESTKKLVLIAIIVAALLLPMLACAGSDHATPAWNINKYTIQAGDAMDLSCAANPSDPNCDAFSK